MASIARRLWLAYFIFSIVLVCSMAFMVELINDDLERTVLDVDFEGEGDFFMAQYDLEAQREPFDWRSSTLIIYFIPSSYQGFQNPPAVFAGTGVPFRGEVRKGEEWYLIRNENLAFGNLFMAKDVSLYEEREALFSMLLLAVSGGVLVISFVLSLFGSRQLVEPLRELARRISTIPAGPDMPRLPLTYADAELQSIAKTFNTFLQELEELVKREHLLISMAGHELRTPVAVASGALDVIEQRGQLRSDDQATMNRLRKTVQEMNDNIMLCLKLALPPDSDERGPPMTAVSLVQSAMEDLGSAFNIQSRMRVEGPGGNDLIENPLLAKLVLLNLLRNALQHTNGHIVVRLLSGRIEVRDEGQGLTVAEEELLSTGKRPLHEAAAQGKLGLYIATLASERLGWKMHVEELGATGNAIVVLFDSKGDSSQPSTTPSI